MIYIVWASPREGKTFFATKWALEQMKKGKKRVFSNYPIFDKKLGGAYVWSSDMCSEDITDSFFIIDEAYRDFNSRNYKAFTPDEHTFFSLNGHNGNDIVLIAHSPQRLDVVIREMVTVFYFVSKFQIPFMKRPLWFKVEGYLDEVAISQRYNSKYAVYSTERFLFKRRVANAYDTHFFRRPANPDRVYVKWGDSLAGSPDGLD